MKLSCTTISEDQTIALGEAVGRALEPGDAVLLHGELGAGKTRFVRGVATALGADPTRVSSPTFIIMQEYPCRGGPFKALVHADAYRITGSDELDTIGWDRVTAELLARSPVVAIIEWAERLERSIPQDVLRINVTLEHAPDGRRVTIDAPDAVAARPAWNAVAARVQTGAPRAPTRCPITGRPVSPGSPTYPFFDERARLADLGRWLSGGYSISRQPNPDEDDGQE